MSLKYIKSQVFELSLNEQIGELDDDGMQMKEMIAEEEQALVRRGFEVTWHARRRYPRALRGEIPMAVSYSLPFLRDGDGGIAPANLEWSHTILGARRAALEVPSPWKGGPGHAEFALVPADFETNGPHRLILKTRVRPAGLRMRRSLR